MESGDIRKILDLGSGVPMQAMRKCLCDKLIPTLERTRRCYSGCINYDEALCEDCRKVFDDHARVVCLKCRRLQGFVKPYRDKITGFEMRRRAHYHIYGCPQCIDGVSNTPILEHVAHCRANGVPTKLNLDLLQEIEQKGLQGEREAEKLRSELDQFGTP